MRRWRRKERGKNEGCRPNADRVDSYDEDSEVEVGVECVVNEVEDEGSKIFRRRRGTAKHGSIEISSYERPLRRQLGPAFRKTPVKRLHKTQERSTKDYSKHTQEELFTIYFKSIAFITKRLYIPAGLSLIEA